MDMCSAIDVEGDKSVEACARHVLSRASENKVVDEVVFRNWARLYIAYYCSYEGRFKAEHHALHDDGPIATRIRARFSDQAPRVPSLHQR
jgi:hypothetical protein